MKAEFAIFTTDGDTPDELPMPVSMEKITDVATGRSTFTSSQDFEIANWMLKISKILTLR